MSILACDYCESYIDTDEQEYEEREGKVKCEICTERERNEELASEVDANWMRTGGELTSKLDKQQATSNNKSSQKQQ